MAETMTYSSLVTDIPSYLENISDQLIAQIPRFVMLAEQRLASEIKLLGFQGVVTGTMSALANTLPKPAFWHKTTSFNITVGSGPTAKRVELLPRSYEYARNFWPAPASTDTPRFYSDYNFDNFLIVPTPDVDYEFELLYNARLQPLDISHQTNWLTVNAPQLILYASILEAQLWLQNPEKVSQWQSMYDRALASYNHEDVERKDDRTTVNE